MEMSRPLAGCMPGRAAMNGWFWTNEAQRAAALSSRVGWRSRPSNVALGWARAESSRPRSRMPAAPAARLDQPLVKANHFTEREVAHQARRR